MRIFVSCAAKDSDIATRLRGELTEAGFAVWDPAEEISPGDNWAKEMGLALEQSDLMVVLVTRGALESESLRSGPT